MVPRQTAYHHWGNGKNRMLRFSKSGDPNIEKTYSSYYIWNQSQEKKLKVINEAMPNKAVQLTRATAGLLQSNKKHNVSCL